MDLREGNQALRQDPLAVADIITATKQNSSVRLVFLPEELTQYPTTGSMGCKALVLVAPEDLGKISIGGELQFFGSDERNIGLPLPNLGNTAHHHVRATVVYDSTIRQKPRFPTLEGISRYIKSRVPHHTEIIRSQQIDENCVCSMRERLKVLQNPGMAISDKERLVEAVHYLSWNTCLEILQRQSLTLTQCMVQCTPALLSSLLKRDHNDKSPQKDEDMLSAVLETVRYHVDAFQSYHQRKSQQNDKSSEMEYEAGNLFYAVDVLRRHGIDWRRLHSEESAVEGYIEQLYLNREREYAREVQNAVTWVSQNLAKMRKDALFDEA